MDTVTTALSEARENVVRLETQIQGTASAERREQRIAKAQGELTSARSEAQVAAVEVRELLQSWTEGIVSLREHIGQMATLLLKLQHIAGPARERFEAAVRAAGLAAESDEALSSFALIATRPVSVSHSDAQLLATLAPKLWSPDQGDNAIVGICQDAASRLSNRPVAAPGPRFKPGQPSRSWPIERQTP